VHMADIDPIDALIDDINSLTTPSTSRVQQQEPAEDGNDDGSYEDEPLVDDLDAMILEIEGKKGPRRQKPTTKDGQSVGARKNQAARKPDVHKARDGDDLDRILEEIQNKSKQKAKENMNRLGWGVVNAERKLDLVAPKYVLKNQDIKATLVVSSNAGERAPLPRDQLTVSVTGSNAPVQVKENSDGTFAINFLPKDAKDEVFLVIHTYGEEQFNWRIELCGNPDATKCTATSQETYKLNQRGEFTLFARDGNNKQLRCGGAKFTLSFAGAGQLNDVNLLDRMDGSYTLTFVPSTVGHYGLFISLDGVDIASSPVQFMVTK